MKTVPDQLREKALARGMDAVVALSPENVAYTIGFMVASHPTNRHRRTISIVAADGREALIVVGVEAGDARDRSVIKDIRSYDQFSQDPMTVLAEALKGFGLVRGTVGIELDYLPAQDYVSLTALLPHLTLKPARELYLEARMVKTNIEVSSLRRAARISDRAEQVAFETLEVGMTEKALAAAITGSVMSDGGDGVRLNLGAGERSSIVNPKATERVMTTGDVIRVEVMASLDNYQSNVTRTGVLGPATDEQRRIWGTLMEARSLALERLHPGTSASDLWGTYARHIRASGIEPSLAFFGHGIGLTGHEMPYLTADNTVVMQPGMVLTFEPFHMIEGRMGFHIEDMFLITDTGYEVLSDITTNEHLIEVR